MRSRGRPNILVIMSDDVGIWNLSAYHRGMMGGSAKRHGCDMPRRYLTLGGI
jgi:arylsulfatase A-like enzyme